MKPQMQFLVVALLVFVAIAGTATVLSPPDPYTQLIYMVPAFLLPWPIAYWIAYRSGAASTGPA